METISTTAPTAYKPHQCNLCGGKIKAGEKYQCQTNTDGGRIYNFKTHLHCDFLAHHYDMYDELDGLDEMGFEEIISDIYYDGKRDDKSIAEIAKILYDRIKVNAT